MSSLFLVSVTAQTSPYDPWADLDDDGDIDIYDIVDIAGRYGTTGTAINKTAKLLELEERISILEELVLDPIRDGLFDGLVAHWKFDEGNGTAAYDSSGNNNTGTLMNGATWVEGRCGSALSFDGSDDYVNCGTLGNFGSIAFGENTTYMFWISTNQTAESRIMGTINDGPNTAFVIELNVAGFDKLRIYTRDETDAKLSGDSLYSVDLVGTGWHHIAFV
ncbi:hypothetical protein KA005_60675, partial [bacterium]|nr:hypothetical protein [bacterium]